MIEHPRPMRADVTDIANAVLAIGGSFVPVRAVSFGKSVILVIWNNTDRVPAMLPFSFLSIIFAKK